MWFLNSHWGFPQLFYSRIFRSAKWTPFKDVCMLRTVVGWIRVQGLQDEDWQGINAKMRTAGTNVPGELWGKHWATKHYSSVRQVATFSSWANGCISWTFTSQWQQHLRCSWRKRPEMGWPTKTNLRKILRQLSFLNRINADVWTDVCFLTVFKFKCLFLFTNYICQGM